MSVKLELYRVFKEVAEAGNITAAAQTLQALKATGREEVDWFLDNCLEPFSRNIDQM